MPATTRVRSRLIAGSAALLASIAFGVGPALPAAAGAGSHHRVLTYVALGDSYAAGQATSCAHTASSYPLRLDALHRIKLLRDAACASATTETVRATQLRALRPGVKLVTVTVGANDLDLTAVAAACSPNPSTDACTAAVISAQQGLIPLAGELVTTYRAIAAAAPKATILVTGYPLLVSDGPVATAEAKLNEIIEGAVAVAAAQGIDIRFVPVDFSGHTLDSADPWFETSGPNAFHPNAEGDAAIAAALAAAAL